MASFMLTPAPHRPRFQATWWLSWLQVMICARLLPPCFTLTIKFLWRAINITHRGPCVPLCRVDGQTQTQLQQPVAWRHCADPAPQRGSPDIVLTVVAPAKCDNAGSAGAGRVELRVAPGSRRPLGRGAGSPLRGGGPPQLGGSRLPAPHQRSATVARWRGNDARGTACCVPAAAAGAGQQHRRWGRGVAARGPVHGGGPVDAHRHLRLDPQLLLAPAAAPRAVLAGNFAHLRWWKGKRGQPTGEEEGAKITIRGRGEGAMATKGE